MLIKLFFKSFSRDQLYLILLKGGYINGHSFQHLCGPFTWVCVTPSLSLNECFFSNAAWGLFERHDRQKAERTFFLQSQTVVFIWSPHKQISSLSRSLLTGHFVQDLHGSTDQSLWPPFFAPVVLKSSTMGCWLYGKHQNNYVLCFGGRAAF